MSLGRCFRLEFARTPQMKWRYNPNGLYIYIYIIYRMILVLIYYVPYYSPFGSIRCDGMGHHGPWVVLTL